MIAPGDTSAKTSARADAEAPGTGGLILCPTSAFMEWPTCNPEKVANYLAFIQAGLEFGQDFA